MSSVKRLIPGFFLICFFFMQALKAEPLCHIPQEEKEKIEKLFSYLFLDEGFAYVLFGSKPMSTIGHDKTTPESYATLYPHPLFELESWWQIWEKYQHLFPMKNYFFFFRNNERWFEAFLINIPNFLIVLKKNLSLFNKKLGKNLTVEEMYEHIVSSNDIFKEGLNQNQALYGILLGYGKRNSLGFEKYYSKKKKSYLSSPRLSVDIMPIEEKELMVPSFSSFSTKETLEILKKYSKERDAILNVYSKENFFELTLTRLMSDAFD